MKKKIEDLIKSGKSDEDTEREEFEKEEEKEGE